MENRPDVLHLDDVIIDGSLCVGFDCVNGEAFGFDTVRLKENNLRIHFLDTSVAASYPDNDWRIIINDSANGGSEYFGVEDSSAGRFPFRIFAGARANALVVDSQGDVGVGTATPATDIHIKIGDTPTLRLEQDGTSGFQPQTWDVAGNETNFFIRDVTNGSQLPLRIRPDAPTSSIDVANDGDVGMGIGSPSQALHVNRNTTGNVSVRIENDNADWDVRVNTVGDFAVTAAGSGVNELTLEETTGNMTLAGTLVTGGGGTCAPPSPACDGVFRPEEYSLESIEEHAAYMWENEHLWGVGPTPAGAPMDLTRKTTGILHELEKAHIYIEQLNGRVKQLEAELRKLTARQ
jgi:hypothetical protein